MEKIALAVNPRSTEEKAKWLRREKLIPAEVYGHGFENQHLKIDYQTFRRVFEQATYSTIITLEIEGGQEVPVLVHDVQYHPVTDDIVHIDFYAVRMDEKVTTHIALDFVGESAAVRLGAMLSTNKHDLEVSCLPADLVHNIAVDISVLENVGDTIRVSDIKVPQGIEILDAVEAPVVSAIEPKVIEEEEPEAEEAAEGEEAGEAGEAGEAVDAEKKEGEKTESGEDKAE